MKIHRTPLGDMRNGGRGEMGDNPPPLPPRHTPKKEEERGVKRGKRNGTISLQSVSTRKVNETKCRRRREGKA